MTIEEKSNFANDGQLPVGFRFAGITCGIKPSGKPDLALIVSDSPSVAAGVYTQNQIVAAPVLVCRGRTPSNSIRAVIINSGNANACTGQQGLDDANEVCRLVAKQVGCQPDQVLVMSTGVIGRMLPMEIVCAGIDAAHQQLAGDLDHFNRAAEAIRTTDKFRKTIVRTISCGDRSYSIAALAKGAGMIAPNMATMLAVITTDAPLSPHDANELLKVTADKSFNRVSVDGHTSTNDTLLLLSSGQGTPLSGEPLRQFAHQLEAAAIELAKQLVADGEGATHVMAISIRGAEHDQAAFEIAKTVAASPLVKTAISGGDPNWGRIVSAAGYAAAKIDPHATSLRVCGETIYRNGSPQPFDAATLSRRMKASHEVPIELTVGNGPGQSDYWSSDLTIEYVQFNAEYTT
jgi:glutamate N-acetyltransferase/amino-acid N-acetyltransferase